MNKHIEREWLVKFVEKRTGRPIDEYLHDNTKTETNPSVTDKQLSTDGAKVKHSKWKYVRWCEFQCPECGVYSKSEPYKGMENYCPNCGVMMDGVEY